jgi:hypothetical protein
MKFSRIESAIGHCKAHLQRAEGSYPELESLLAGHLVVLISAEFELRVMALVEARAARVRDEHIKAFVSYAARKLLRGLKIEQLTGMLRAFHKGCVKRFHDTADNAAKNGYDSIMNNRHAFVHDGICNVTVGDIEQFFTRAASVFSGIVAAFDLKAQEVRDLV